MSAPPLSQTPPQVIRSYGPGRFRIGEQDWQGPVLVTPGLTTAWNVARAEDLSLDNLAPAMHPSTPTEFLILGCGPRAIFIAPDLRAALKGGGLALEVVDTGAACRLYNVLLAENRRVAAALIPL